MIKLETVTCYNCGHFDATPWGDEQGFHMVKCTGCGLVYLNPRPTLDEIDHASQTGLHKLGSESLNVVGRYSRRKAKVYRERLHALLDPPSASAPVRWLDIGSGYGELLQAVLDLGFRKIEAEGVEPCLPKVERARSRGLPVSSKRLDELSGPYTHVSLINVYSHLPDPIEFLASLRRIMTPGARLVLVTGNGADVVRAEFPGALYLPDHLSFACESIVRNVFEIAGYAVTRVQAYPDGPGFDPMPITLAKNLARKLLGRPMVPLRLPKESRFQSLWVSGELAGSS